MLIMFMWSQIDGTLNQAGVMEMPPRQTMPSAEPR
jgi:hypothetical protein